MTFNWRQRGARGRGWYVSAGGSYWTVHQAPGVGSRWYICRDGGRFRADGTLYAISALRFKTCQQACDYVEQIVAKEAAHVG